MKFPAARVTDMTACPMIASGPVPHVGGPIIPPCCPTVITCGMPQARIGDRAICAAGGPASIVTGAYNVIVGGSPAARITDKTSHGGVIVTGCYTVLIGTEGMSSASIAPPSVLDGILKDYQAKEGEMIDWEPKIGGIVPTFGIFGSHTVTASEGSLLDSLAHFRGLVGMNRFRNIATTAFEKADERFPPMPMPEEIGNKILKQDVGDKNVAKALWPHNDGHNDAFRHAYWNALLTREFGEEWTKQFTTAHEGIPNNPAAREAMDLYNNDVGRQIATNNPGASDEEIANLVEKEIQEGRLIVINQDCNLEWSNNVNYGEHGLTHQKSNAGKIDIQQNNRSAR